MKKYFSLIIIVTLCWAVPALCQESSVKELTAGGMKIIFKPSTKQIISVRMFIKGGTANYTKELEGIESLALAVVTEGGTKSRSMNEFNAALSKVGATVGSTAGYDFSQVNLSCIKTHWEESWKLYTEALITPAFSTTAFDLIKSQELAGAREQEADPDTYLENKSMELSHPGGNYAKNPSGTAASLEKITLDQIRAQYQKILVRKNIFFVVVGNLTEEDLISKVNAAFGSLDMGTTAVTETRKAIPAATTIEDRQIATNYILGSMSVPSMGDKEGTAMRVAMSIMGDRFFVELRTKRSLTYAPGAYYQNFANGAQAVFYASSVKPKEALQVMITEINSVKNTGFAEKELKDKKEDFLTGHFLRLETNDAQSQAIGVAEINGGWKATETFMAEVEKLKISDLNAVFSKYSNAINWMYLGKKSEVATADFKQPQMLPNKESLKKKQ